MPFPAIASNQVLKIACKSTTPDRAVEIESQLGVTSLRDLTRLGRGANIHLHEGGSAENEVLSLQTPAWTISAKGPTTWPTYPPNTDQHGSPLACRSESWRKNPGSTPHLVGFAPLLLAPNSCGSLPEVIRRLAISQLVFAPEAIRTPEPCDVRFGQGKERKN